MFTQHVGYLCVFTPLFGVPPTVDVGKTTPFLSLPSFPTLLFAGAPDGALRRRVGVLSLAASAAGRDEVGVDHDVSEALPALAPAAQALRVELQRLEPQSRLLGVVALQEDGGMTDWLA